MRTLVDTRERPWSRFKQFSKWGLKAACEQAGITYAWTGHLGASLMKLSDEEVRERLVQRLPHWEGPICLLCAERNPQNCHRGLRLQPVLKDMGKTVVHLFAEARRPEKKPTGRAPQLFLF